MYLGNMLWKGNGFTSLQVWTNTVAGHSGKYTTSTYARVSTFLAKLILTSPFPIRKIQTDNDSEFTNVLLAGKANKKSLFKALLEEYGMIYHRIRIAISRHNGQVERQHRLDQERFFDHLCMSFLEDSRKQLALYQRKSNDYIEHRLNLRSPNQILEHYLALFI